MEQNQAINVLVQVANLALGAGLFKSFEEAKVVGDAIEAFKQPSEKEADVKEKAAKS